MITTFLGISNCAETSQTHLTLAAYKCATAELSPECQFIVFMMATIFYIGCNRSDSGRVVGYTEAIAEPSDPELVLGLPIYLRRDFSYVI